MDVGRAGYRLRPCKGDYFSLAPSLGRIAERLIYPVPHGAGLGVHLTVDLGGRYRLGPDGEYVEAFSYSGDPATASAIAEAARSYRAQMVGWHIATSVDGISCE